MKLIDKSALVAEIDNLENTYKKCPTHNSYEEGLKDGRLIGYKDALHKINTLEVKEVDLDFQHFVKELAEVYALPASITENTKENPLNWEYAIAKHFFELGIKARKE